MKVKFISFNYTSPFSFNPVYYWLKSFYKKTGVHYDKYTWLRPEHMHKADVLDKVVAEKPDILCLSIFVWNVDSIMTLAAQIKEQLPDITVICGGPECYAHTDPDWFDLYPFVDYAVYGDGEKAFADLLDYFQDNSLDYSAIPNIVTRQVKNKHEIFKFSEYPAYSPYVDLEEEFLDDYLGLKKDIEGSVYLPYELARGCMYNCSFCDWHGGIHHKVNRRIHDWKQDVDLFARNHIRAFQTDANVGIYVDDVEFYKYVAEKAVEAGPDRMIPVEPRNMAKLNKGRVEEIWDILSELDNKPRFAIKSAVQSIYEDTLSAIERPDISWEEHKDMLRRVKEKHPNNQLTAEVIIGLPGMTFDRIKETFIEFADANVDQAYSYDWMMLKKSPAALQSYRDENNLEVTKTYYPSLFHGLHDNHSRARISMEEFLSDPDKLIQRNLAYYIDMIYDREAGVEGVIYHKVLNALYNKMARQGDLTPDKLRAAIDMKNDFYIDFVKDEAEKQKEFLDQYEFFFWGSFDEDSGLVKTYEFLIDKII